MSRDAAGPHWRAWFRLAATLAAWVVVVAYAHRLTHVYEAALVSVLNAPVHQVAATAMLLTVLAYLVVLTLPMVPNLRLRHLGVVVVWATLLAIAVYVSHIGLRDAQAALATLRADIGLLALVLLALAYAVALAMPFVPGMELGLLLMIAFGPLGVLVVYAATLLGLGVAYLVGSAVPSQVLLARLKTAGPSTPGQDLASTMAAWFSASRLGRIAPRRWVARLSAHRYLALAIALNVPGNAVVGGGGGIALLCGMSRQFGWRAYLLTVAAATSPVPILILTGLLNLDPAADGHGDLHRALTWLEHLFDTAR